MGAGARLGLVAAGVLLVGSPAHADAPFGGHGDGVLHPAALCGLGSVSVCRTAEGTARGDVLGPATFTGRAVVDHVGNCDDFRLELHLSARDGSRLDLVGAGHRTGTATFCDKSAAPHDVPFAGSYTVAGGTGRFATATGSGEFTGALTGTDAGVDEAISFDWAGKLAP